MTAFDAMTLGTAGFTAALAIHLMQHNGLEPDNGPVAVTGATGGVGSVAVEILAKLGYEVHAITGKPEEARYLKGIGAKEIVDRRALDLAKIRPLDKATWAGAVDNLGGDLLAWLLSTSRIGGTVAAVGLAADMKLNTTVAPFILRGVHLLGADSANTPMALRQTIWNKLAVEWRPDQVHDQVRTIDFDELPTHFDAYLKGMVRGRTVVRIGRGYASVAGISGIRDRGDEHECERYREAHRRSLEDREGYWREKAKLVDWRKPFTRVLDYSRPPFAKWFVGGTTNLCHNAIDRHLATRGDQPALIYISTETGETRRYTFRELPPRSIAPPAMLESARRRQGRSRADLHADDPRGGVRDARVRAHRRDPFGRVRRVRGGEPRDAHRRREAGRHGHRRRRHARRQGGPLQAPRRRGDPPREASAGARHHRRPRPRSRHGAHARAATSTTPTLREQHLGRAGAVRVARVVRAFVHPLHVGHDRQAEGRAARHRRLRGRARGVDARHLLRRARRDDVHDQRHRLGRRPLVHHLRRR